MSDIRIIWPYNWKGGFHKLDGGMQLDNIHCIPFNSVGRCTFPFTLRPGSCAADCYHVLRSCRSAKPASSNAIKIAIQRNSFDIPFAELTSSLVTIGVVSDNPTSFRMD